MVYRGQSDHISFTWELSLANCAAWSASCPGAHHTNDISIEFETELNL